MGFIVTWILLTYNSTQKHLQKEIKIYLNVVPLHKSYYIMKILMPFVCEKKTEKIPGYFVINCPRCYQTHIS